MCLIMHLVDVRIALEGRLGARRPLARTDPPHRLDFLWLTYFHLYDGRPPVPDELVLIYAPRDEEEVEVVRPMMGAAWWSLGGALKGE